jgi:hypothetical protein
MSLEKLIPKFNSEKFLKSRLTSNMWLDSNDFLYRVKLMQYHRDHDGYSIVSKIYVDILMAIESDLKSLIISLSKNDETPENAYLVARNHSHRIENLYAEVELRARNRIKLLNQKDKDELLNNAINIKVSNRYQLITQLNIGTEDFIHTDFGIGKYSSLLQPDYLLKIENISRRLHWIANESSKRFMPKLIMTGDSIGIYHDRLKEFAQNLGRRL